MGFTSKDWLPAQSAWRTLTALEIKEKKNWNTETVNNSGEVIMLAMVEKGRAELEAIYRRTMIWPIIADSPPRERSRI